MLLALYGNLDNLYRAWLGEGEQNEMPQVLALIQRLAQPEWARRCATLGNATNARTSASPETRRVLHDVRGGALPAIIGFAQFAASDPEDVALQREVILLARDHAKMMRNGIRNVDPPGRAHDEQWDPHYMDDIEAKRRHDQYTVGSASAAINVCNSFQGAIASCCLEISALDRILFNFVNHAVQYAADGEVELHSFPLSDEIVRFVVSNPITAAVANRLREEIGGDLGRLFGAGSAASNIGLSNWALFVASAFGLGAPAVAVEKSYLGARIAGDWFHTWFHWPVLKEHN